MNENYKLNNFILFFLVEVQYIKKTKQSKRKENKYKKQESKQTEHVLFFLS